MADSEVPVPAEAAPAPPAPVRYADLLPRAVVGGLLIAVALFGGWRGGLFFDFLIGLAALLIFVEWARMHGVPRRNRLMPLIIMGFAIVVADSGAWNFAYVVLIGGAALCLFQSRAIATGTLYAGVPALALIWLREQPPGFGLVIWTLAIVWATDICAYFAGRTLGGPKIAPSISPSKTWAGLGGGMIGAAIVAMLLDLAFDLPFAPWISAMLGAVLAIAAQAGDFYESHLKRRAGVKDSGNILPGHGGVMDRLDGLVPVAVLVASAVWLLEQ